MTFGYCQDEVKIQESVNRFIEYAQSSELYFRTLVGSTALETLPIVASSPKDVATVLELLSTVAVDPQVEVRCNILEYIVHIALMLSDPNKSCETLRSFITSHVLPIIVTALLDVDSKVVKLADCSLIALLEHCLVPNGYVQERIWPAIVKKMYDHPLTDSIIRVITLMSKMVPWVGCDTTETLFVPLFVQLCSYPDVSPRNACASIIGDFCAVVSLITVENKLMPSFLTLCGDSMWAVRKACAEMFTSVSSAASSTTRSERLAPAFARLLSDSHDYVRSAAFQSLGPFITTFAQPSVTNLGYNHQGKLVLRHHGGFEFQLNANIELNCADSVPHPISSEVMYSFDDDYEDEEELKTETRETDGDQDTSKLNQSYSEETEDATSNKLMESLTEENKVCYKQTESCESSSKQKSEKEGEIACEQKVSSAEEDRIKNNDNESPSKEDRVYNEGNTNEDNKVNCVENNPWSEKDDVKINENESPSKDDGVYNEGNTNEDNKVYSVENNTWSGEDSVHSKQNYLCIKVDSVHNKQNDSSEQYKNSASDEQKDTAKGVKREKVQNKETLEERRDTLSDENYSTARQVESTHEQWNNLLSEADQVKLEPNLLINENRVIQMEEEANVSECSSKIVEHITRDGSSGDKEVVPPSESWIKIVPPVDKTVEYKFKPVCFEHLVSVAEYMESTSAMKSEIEAKNLLRATTGNRHRSLKTDGKNKNIQQKETSHEGNTSKNNVQELKNEDDFSQFAFWRDPIPNIDIDPRLVSKYKESVRIASVTVIDPQRKKNYKSQSRSRKFALHAENEKEQSEAELSQILFDALMSFSKGKLFVVDGNGNNCDERRGASVVPDELINHFVSMSSPRQGKMQRELAHHCAYNLPAVALTLGPQNWALIRQACNALAADEQWRVRKIVASSIHELAVIVGSEVATEDLVPVFTGFMKDLDEVRIGALKHLANFLKLLQPAGRNSFLPRLSEFLLTDYDWNWRFRAELAEQLLQIVRLFAPWDVSVHLTPVVFQLLQDKVAHVRNIAAQVVVEVISVINKEGILVRSAVAELAEQFAHSSRWSRRQTFAHLCSKLVEEKALPMDMFARDILPHLLDLSWDKVPNVRLSVARTLSHHVMALDEFSNVSSPHHEVVMVVLKRLQGDKDRDVRFFSSLTPQSFSEQISDPAQLPESSTIDSNRVTEENQDASR